MFELDRASQQSLDAITGGALDAGLSDVYRAQRQADRLGGQTWSEVALVHSLLEEQAQELSQVLGRDVTAPSQGALVSQFEGRFDADNYGRTLPQPNDQPGLNLTNPQIPLMEQALWTDAGTQLFKEQEDQWRLFQSALNEAAVTRGATHLKTLDELRDEAGRRAQKAREEAARTSARASGFDSFMGNTGAGFVQFANEPTNIAGVVLTAPIAAEAFGSSLLARVMGIGATEGVVGAVSESAVQEQLIDYYQRQGMTAEEARELANNNVAMAAASGAVLGPLLYGDRIAAQRTIDRIASDIDPDTMRQVGELRERQATLRQSLKALEPERERMLEAQLRPLTEQIAALRQRMAGLSKRRQKKLQPELERLEAERDEFAQNFRSQDTPQMAHVRSELQQVDYQLRDLAAPANRARQEAQARAADETAPTANQDRVAQQETEAMEARLQQMEQAFAELQRAQNTIARVDAQETPAATRPSADNPARTQAAQRLSEGAYTQDLEANARQFLEEVSQREGIDPNVVAGLRQELNDLDSDEQALEAALMCLRN